MTLTMPATIEIEDNSIEGIFQRDLPRAEIRAWLHQRLEQLGLSSPYARRVLIDCLFYAHQHATWGGAARRTEWGLNFLEHAILVHLAAAKTRGCKWLEIVEQWANCRALALSADSWRKVFAIAINNCFSGKPPDTVTWAQGLVEGLLIEHSRIGGPASNVVGSKLCPAPDHRAASEPAMSDRHAMAPLQAQPSDVFIAGVAVTLKSTPFGLLEITCCDCSPGVTVIAEYLSVHGYRAGLLKNPAASLRARSICVVCPAGSMAAKKIIHEITVIGSFCRDATGITTYYFDHEQETTVMEQLYQLLQG